MSSPLSSDIAAETVRPFKAELVATVIERESKSLVAVLVATLALAGLLCLQLPPAYPLLWLALVWGASFAHMAYLARAHEHEGLGDERKLVLVGRSFLLHLGAMTLVFLFFPFVPVTTGAIMSVVACGIVAATISSSIGYRPIFLPYALIGIVPGTGMWLFSPNLDISLWGRGLIVLLAAAYLYVLFGQGRLVYQAFEQAHRNRELLRDAALQLRAALAESEAASVAKTRFLASASHDLRQPIHALSLFTGALLQRPLESGAAGIAVQIDQAVKTVGAQLDTLLDVSRLDAGVIEPVVATVDLALGLRQLAEEFAPQAQAKGLGLDIDLPQTLRVETDAALLQQVMRNLMANAIKYTDRGWISLSAEQVNGHCRVSVADTGPGIPLDEQERVFEEFYQLNNPARDRSLGLGLGLSIVRRLCLLLRIPLKLRSAPGEGTEFTLELQVSARQPLPAAPVTVAEVDVREVDVLVLDDEPSVRLGMRTLLEGMGFRVGTADSIKAALEAARTRAPGIVVADFRLAAGEDGIAAVRALRDLVPGLPALLVSGDTAPDRLQQAQAAGLEMLHKPVAAARLRERILITISQSG